MTETKIFYVGFQRVGTKSFGRFMELNGYNIASWDVASKYGWPELYSNADFDTIINSKSFGFYDVFEDGPWFFPKMVKFLYHEVENSKFIMLKRPADDWFKSMISHSAGLTLGNVRRHCEIYDRMDDYEWLRQHTNFNDNMRLSLYDKPNHYMNVYKKNTEEIQLFFEKMSDGKERFFDGDLYDIEKYTKIANFLNIASPISPDVFFHKSTIKVEDVISTINSGQDSTFKSIRTKNKQNKLKSELIEELHTLLELSPDNHRLLFRLGLALFQKGDIEEAAINVKKGINCGSDNPRLHLLMSKIFEKQNDIPNAIVHIKLAIEITNDNPLFYQRLGNLFKKNGSLEEAKLAHERFVDLAPYK